MFTYTHALLICIITDACFAASPLILPSTKKTPIKLYAIYTPSHEILVNTYFLPSLKKYNNFDITLVLQPQECPSAVFKSQGWTKTTRKKVDLIIQAIDENWGDMFVFSDVDIQFFAPIEQLIPTLMEGYDLRIQRNAPGDKPCTGFFICRANKKTRALWCDVRQYMEECTQVSDQLSFIRCLLGCNPYHGTRNPYTIRWDYLPDMFFSAGTLEAKQWKPGQKLRTPHKIVLHHANWTTGIDNKIAQLTYVEKLVRYGKIVPYSRATF
ncbi:MAG TPA: putative nucleotide-diphospho-sugar transferase [Candidatus Bathyarchaeia archaeon]|nr:putative nucleotide-diphospho-sugar transferase [Candidatus Bathyarchaeia archaeon]